ncbi:hypothetical protein IHE45_03G029400 [Dioscorea alata]|uniref:Uncharacterized protein n=1 Tax=Dioscorea alata TaxID=55571 RepID=A0ACB7WKA4_DIOAL|nr:hypothetical protein IHE45_03G029400 [Dioscorea alata]
MEAAQGLLQCVLDGCLSGFDDEIRRRPYHRNCSCALHRSEDKAHAHHCFASSKISFPLRGSWYHASISYSLSMDYVRS